MHDANNSSVSKAINMKTLPKIGYIAYLNDKTPIAAGFLRRLEPCFGQIDTLVTNAYMGSIVRHQGMLAVTDALMNDAIHVLKLEGLICHTSSQDIIKRATEAGFHILNQQIIAKRLR